MTSSSRALIGLGTNLPFRGLEGPALLEAALRAIQEEALPVLSVSSAWRSAAWPDPSQPAFTNAVAALDPGARRPDEVYGLLEAVERRFGRIRTTRWGSRTLDLDLLDYSSLQGEWGGIKIPHTHISERCFVLAPLKEVDPNWVHPLTKIGVSGLLDAAKCAGALHRIGSLRIAPSSRAD